MVAAAVLTVVAAGFLTAALAAPAGAAVGTQLCSANQTKTIVLPTRRDIVVTVNTCIKQDGLNYYQSDIKVRWWPGADSDPIDNAKFDGFSVYNALQLNNSTVQNTHCDEKSAINGASSGSLTCTVYRNDVNVGYWTGDGSITYNVNSDGKENLPTWNLTGSPNYCEAVCMDPIPARSDGMNKTTIFVHGYDANPGDTYPGLNQQDYWGDVTYDFQTGAPGALSSANTQVWCYYLLDVYCNQWFANDTDRSTSIITLGAALAVQIYEQYSYYGKSVDLVGHSMGGLIIKAALTGVQKHYQGFPPFLYVEDVTTLETPHRGTSEAGNALCALVPTLGRNQECADMLSGSAFMNWLIDNPQAQTGTDWTVIGADDDLLVPASSSVPGSMPAAHKVIYTSGQWSSLYAHMDVLHSPGTSRRYIFCDAFLSLTCADRNTFSASTGLSPVRQAHYATDYQYLY
jgi:hypothetical protein